MASCIGEIAKNIAFNCESPLENGYTGRGVLIPMSASPAFTFDADNPRIISAIGLDASAKVCSIDNEGVDPFSSSATTGNNDAGFVKFTKTLQVRIMQRGAEFAKDLIEPLIKSGQGFVAVLEKVDKAGDGSYEVLGAYKPLKVADPATVTRNEYENGGAWMATLQTSEVYSEVVLFDTDYTTTKTMFEALLAKQF